MKTIFDPIIRAELKDRIQTIHENNKAQWGKMNVYQMAKHSTKWNDWLLGNGQFVYKQEFLGKLFGKMALKSTTKNDKPMDKNIPAAKDFVVKEKDIHLDEQKVKWMSQIDAFENYKNDAFIHDFFGQMSLEEIGIFVYKHNDHHLRQFNLQI